MPGNTAYITYVPVFLPHEENRKKKRLSRTDTDTEIFVFREAIIFLFKWKFWHYRAYESTLDIQQCTEVGRAFLINFQKWFLNIVFIRIRIAKKFNFMSESLYLVVKVSKRAKKVPKKATNWTYNAFSKKIFVLANLKYINS